MNAQAGTHAFPRTFETVACYDCGSSSSHEFVVAQDDLTRKPGISASSFAKTAASFTRTRASMSIISSHTMMTKISHTAFVSNHTATLDLFILLALGLPNARFSTFGGTRKWLPMAVIGHLIGTFYTPAQTIRAERVKCFERAERLLRRTGESVYLSSEGARITTGQIGSFNKGTFHLATNLKAPIATSKWKIEDLESNKKRLRDFFLRTHYELERRTS